jgi:charged multivesicular body protein 7
VVNDALARREWMACKEFLEMRESLYYKGWGIRIPTPGEVLYWGLRQLGLSFGEGKMPTGTVVVLENLEKAGKEVMRRLEVSPKGRVERIFSRTAFVETFGDILGTDTQLSDQDLEVLLQFLARDKGVLVYDKETVKFKAPNEKSTEGITNEDSTIAALKTLIQDLERQTSVLEKRVYVLANTAQEAVARKNRVSALAALRSKKLAESTLVKRHATLAQLEEVFAKIEQAADQVELVRVMEASTTVLSGLNKEVGGVERVDGVVERLREEMVVVDEVGEVVGELGRSGVDEGEVDDELEVMEREERERREAVERKEREAREKREAEETRKKLDALEAVEREARDKENAKPQVDATTEKEIEDSTLGMKRMSLDPPAAEAA